MQIVNLFGDKMGEIFGDVREGNKSDDWLLEEEKEVFGDIHLEIKEGYRKESSCKIIWREIKNFFSKGSKHLKPL